MPVIILRNEEDVYGKPMMIPEEMPRFCLRYARNITMGQEPEIYDIVFERTQECLPVGNVLATVYKQLTTRRVED